jgi:hypothetical protein
MRWVLMCAVLAVTGQARAECELSLDVRGAIVDGTLRERIAPGPDVTALDLELPAGGRLVEVALRGKDGAGAAVGVPADHDVMTVVDANVLGADPAIVVAARDSDAGRPRYRAIVEPVASGRDVVLVARWAALAEVRDGELQIVLPGHHDGACKTSVHVMPGPGVSVARVRAGAIATRGASATFQLDEADATVAAELAFARPEPVAWVQRESLGDGYTAEAVTIAAPPAGERSHRALFVIDTSRSMELVGRARVGRVMHAIADALPPGSEVQAIAFDRAPKQLLPDWKRVDGASLAAIDAALAAVKPGNGSDLAGALVLAHNLLAGTKEPTLVVAITDGALGELDGAAISRALSGDRVHLHAIVLDPGELASPSHAALTEAIDRIGGGYVELPVSQYADAFVRADAWLRPSWLGLAIAGTSAEIPAQLRSGDGVVRLAITHAPRPVVLTGHDDRGKISIRAQIAPVGPLAQLALETAGDVVHAKLATSHPTPDRARALVVLAAEGKVARDRRKVVAGGGPFTRMIAVGDPPREHVAQVVPPIEVRTAGLDRGIVERLFELQLQPRAYRCYQDALAAQLAAGKKPSLAGTVQFRIELGRGEVTRATIAGVGEGAFDACLLDAAYSLTPPLPDLARDADERTIATYPLTFVLREEHPIVVAGDADSSSPLDIDSIPAGVPRIDTSTPLGGLKP